MEGTIWETANDPSPAGWRVPTMPEIATLLDTRKVSHEWVTQNGVDGRRFIDIATGNNIFLPAAGWRDYANNGTLGRVGEVGFYWSADYSYPSAYRLGFPNGNLANLALMDTRYGFSVRCVAK